MEETIMDQQLPPQKPSRTKRIAKEAGSWLLHIAAALLLAQLISFLVFQPIVVKGESMQSTLQNGELMYVSKPEYLLGDPSRGDVIICRYPGRTEYFVKRVMGLPGETVEVDHNAVYINGELIPEPYLDDEKNNNGFSMEAFTLGADEYFVMGDNRDNSHDSRNYYGYGSPAAITRDMVVGHVKVVMFPFDSIRKID